MIEARYREFLALWPVPNQQPHLAARFGQTFVIGWGVESCLPPLVLLHGSGSNSAMWLGDAPIWARGRKVYAIDMIGEPGLSAPTRPALRQLAG
jgi:pimeloyl-ACP methyl ester carboxylesterase